MNTIRDSGSAVEPPIPSVTGAPDANGTQRRRVLRRWFRQHGREFPWRETKDPWQLLLAEMLLRRTKADQIARMFENVVDAFPDTVSMAGAGIDTVREVLAPAGLTSRADELHLIARTVLDDFGGNVPTDEETLQSFRGVGPYVASAVSSAMTNRRVTLVDTNTVRVALRVAGVTIDARDVRRQKVVVAAVEDLLGGPAKARTWWAVLDLAALVCRVKEPECATCPIAALCATGAAT